LVCWTTGMLAEAMLLRDSVAIIARSIPLFEIALPQFFHCRVERKSDRIRRVKSGPTTLVVFVALFASLALAKDFTTIKGKEYKNATIIRVEADGIVVRTKMGIAKVYFIELPKTFRNGFIPSPVPLLKLLRHSVSASQSRQRAGQQQWPIPLLL
jgi:hypothetical protein